MKLSKMKPLPTAITRFVARQQTMPLEQICGELPPDAFPFADHWHRAIACMLLSGRVQPKGDGFPNRTDVTRICKESNLNPHFFEHVGRLLVKSKIVDPGSHGKALYTPGENLTAFWDRDLAVLSAAARRSFLSFVGDSTGFVIYRPTFAYSSALDSFARIFAAAFQGLALKEEDVGKVLEEFSQLPAEALRLADQRLAADGDKCTCTGWSMWFDGKGQEAFLSALYACDWANAVEHRGKEWFYMNQTAGVLLGLRKPPKPEPLPVDLKVLPDLSVFAGAGLPRETLLPLFRFCRIKRIDRVFEFQFDPKRLAEQADKKAAVGELRAALKRAGKLPATVEAIFSNKPPARGRIQIRHCRALVKPEDLEVLSAIREHRLLKGYLDADAPPGYLVIKSGSNPSQFLARCRELGFDVE